MNLNRFLQILYRTSNYIRQNAEDLSSGERQLSVGVETPWPQNPVTFEVKAVLYIWLVEQFAYFPASSLIQSTMGSSFACPFHYNPPYHSPFSSTVAHLSPYRLSGCLSHAERVVVITFHMQTFSGKEKMRAMLFLCVSFSSPCSSLWEIMEWRSGECF